MDNLDPFDGDEEAALQYALALSLQEAGHSNVDNPIQLSSDEDDPDDLEKPRAYHRTTTDQEDGDGVDDGDNANANAKAKTEKRANSLISSAKTKKETNDSNFSAKTKKETNNPAKAPPAPTGLAALGLDRKKMEEERLARLGKRKAPSSEPEDAQARQQRLKTSQTSTSVAKTGTSAYATPPSSNPSIGTNTQALRFPRGAVKRTWAYRYPRIGDDIKIEEVLQKKDLELAVVSSFQWDEQWMLSKIDITNTKIVCIAFASSQEQKEQMKANVPKDRIRFCFPPMSSIGNMHSKLMLLKFSNFLRIVIPTGNLVSYDWGETGVVENVGFADISEAHQNKLTPFYEELCYFLKAQGLEESLVGSLRKRSGTSHGEEDWKRTVSTLGCKTTDPVEIDYMVSSMGSVNKELISAIYYAAQGDDGLREYTERTTKGLQWWDSQTFPRRLIHDSKSVRPGLLVHSKAMFVQSDKGRAWAYVGSANLSESAWGRLTRDRQTSNPKLTCRNWECGVVIPVDCEGGSKMQNKNNDLSVFRDRVPVPIAVPADAYGKDSSTRPWLFSDN